MRYCHQIWSFWWGSFSSVTSPQCIVFGRCQIMDITWSWTPVLHFIGTAVQIQTLTITTFLPCCSYLLSKLIILHYNHFICYCEVNTSEVQDKSQSALLAYLQWQPSTCWLIMYRFLFWHLKFFIHCSEMSLPGLFSHTSLTWMLNKYFLNNWLNVILYISTLAKYIFFRFSNILGALSHSMSFNHTIFST